MNFIIDQESFNQIVMGFQANPVDVLIVLGIILGVLALFISFFIVERNRIQRERFRYARQRFEEAAEAKRLSAYEKELIERMAKELPHGAYRKHELLTNSSTFDHAAAKVRQSGEISGEFIAALRIKLEFDVIPENRSIQSTGQLSEGTHLYFINENDERFHGTVYNKRPDALLIKPTDDVQTLPTGKRLKAYFKSKTGVYTFETKVVNIKNNILVCLHSEEVQKEQQRNYYRKELDKAVEIKHNIADEEPVETSLVDLGGGGAKIAYPSEQKNKFKEKDEILLLLTIDEQEELKVPGSVVRVSSDEKYLHIRFNGIREGERDKIIGYVLNA